MHLIQVSTRLEFSSWAKVNLCLEGRHPKLLTYDGMPCIIGGFLSRTEYFAATLQCSCVKRVHQESTAKGIKVTY
jgi:hypothetical protein